MSARRSIAHSPSSDDVSSLPRAGAVFRASPDRPLCKSAIHRPGAGSSPPRASRPWLRRRGRRRGVLRRCRGSRGCGGDAAAVRWRSARHAGSRPALRLPPCGGGLRSQVRRTPPAAVVRGRVRTGRDGHRDVRPVRGGAAFLRARRLRGGRDAVAGSAALSSELGAGRRPGRADAVGEPVAGPVVISFLRHDEHRAHTAVRGRRQRDLEVVRLRQAADHGQAEPRRLAEVVQVDAGLRLRAAARPARVPPR